MEQELRGCTEHSYCVGFHVLTINAVLTRQNVQLFSECSHNDVVLYNVCHLVLQVLLIERDQGIGAGIPNLNETPIMLVVYEPILKCIPFTFI